MKGIIRQVFGTTRPRDIWLDLLTFDRLNTRSLIHIVYWAGLGLLAIAAAGVLGVAIGNIVSDPTPMAALLSIAILVIFWLAILIGVFLWRVVCELILAVSNIAEDLRYLRQFQEKLTPSSFVPSVAPVVEETADAAPSEISEAPAATATQVETPAQSAAPKKDNILEDPFFRPRFERKDL